MFVRRNRDDSVVQWLMSLTSNLKVLNSSLFETDSFGDSEIDSSVGAIRAWGR